MYLFHVHNQVGQINIKLYGYIDVNVQHQFDDNSCMHLHIVFNLKVLEYSFRFKETLFSKYDATFCMNPQTGPFSPNVPYNHYQKNEIDINNK